MVVPRYLKVSVKEMKPSATGMLEVSSGSGMVARL